MSLQRFHASEPFNFTDTIIGWRPGGPMDCLGPWAKVENCPIEGTNTTRTCYATGYADTFFSIPGACKIDGKTVKGFFTQNDGVPMFNPNSKPDPKLPTISDLYQLIRAVKSDISDEYRAFAFEDDDTPGIQLTVGCDTETGEWSYQTGDNSYTGSAYHYPDWAVIGVYRTSNCRELAKDIRSQLSELYWSR